MYKPTNRTHPFIAISFPGPWELAALWVHKATEYTFAQTCWNRSSCARARPFFPPREHLLRKTRAIREFKKLRRQLQRKRHIKIELCVKLSLSRLFHVDHVVQNTRIALSLARYERFSCKGKGWKIYCCELPLSSEPQIWKFHVVVWQTTSKHCTKKRAARAARLFFFIQPMKSLICGVVVDVAVVKS